MLKYLKSCKLEITILGLWIIVLNGYRIFFHVIGVDTEQALLSLGPTLNWTLGWGRFASAILRKILMPYGFNYDMAIVILLIGWLAVGITYQFCLEEFGILNRWCRLLFSVIFVSCPLWAEQNYFVCSVFVNVIGMLITIIAAYLLILAFQKEIKSKYIALSLVLMIISIGIYQSLLYLLIANCIVFLSLYAYTIDLDFKEYIKSGLKCIVVIGIAVAMYFLCARMTIRFLYNPSFDYAGYTDAAIYMSGRIKWFENDIRQCFYAIRTYVINSINPNNVYGTPVLMILWCVLQTLLLIRFLWKKTRKDLVIFVGNILLLINVYLGCLIFGAGITAREQFVIPFVTAFLGVFLINEFLLGFAERSNDIHIFNWKSAAISVVCIYCVMTWGSKQLLLNRTDYIRYNSDVSYADNVMEQVRQAEDYSCKKIVFLGQNKRELSDYYLKGEVIGYSIFTWDAVGAIGVNYRAYAFLQALGYKYIKPTIEEIKEVKEFSVVQGIVEEQDCIAVWNDYIVVDLDKF